ncbi:MAG: CAP domain-containing protein [Alphaproteobacteria bacterium]|nr:MAG: CAP domain-containing protein [Alphaproteobacteria bacterium]
MPYRVLTLILLLWTVALPGCSEVAAPLTGPPPQIAADAVRLDPEAARRSINAYRRSRGLQPLAINPLLTRAAQAHARDLASHDRISHKGSDGSDPWQRVRRAGYEPRLAAENVGVGQRSIAEVIRGWQNSPGHNRNLLLPDATQMGIALVTDSRTRYGTFWTLVLASPL